MQQRTAFVSADLSTRSAGADGAAGDGGGLQPGHRADAPIGAIVGRRRAERAGIRVFGTRIWRTLLAEMLETGALALDHAYRLQRAEAMSVTDDLTGLYNSRFLKEALHRESKRAHAVRPPGVGAVRRSRRVQGRERHARASGGQPDAGGGRRQSSGRARARAISWPGTAATSSWWSCPTRAAKAAWWWRSASGIGLRSTAFLADEGINWRLTASVGVATLPEMARSSDELLDAADRAMYHVKETGKNNVCLASRT